MSYSMYIETQNRIIKSDSHEPVILEFNLIDDCPSGKKFFIRELISLH